MVLEGFSRRMLYKVLHWRKEVTEEHPPKCIICLAPHTSNWDFLIGQLYMRAEGLQANFLMKKEWFFWPLGAAFRKIGGIPICRSRHTRMTDQLASEARRRDTFRLTITPEGTRSRSAEWKSGFYFIALKSGIPILLYAIDYERKLIQCTRTFWPTGDADKDIEEIKQYFRDFKGKHPENFAI